MISSSRTTRGRVQPSPLPLDVTDVEGFRYRVEDVSRAVTKKAVKDARTRELRAEALNSRRLRSYFEDNPKDLQVSVRRKLEEP